jgi:hypothetical protein
MKLLHVKSKLLHLLSSRWPRGERIAWRLDDSTTLGVGGLRKYCLTYAGSLSGDVV